MAKAATTENAKAITRTGAGLREAIFDEMDALRSGSSNPTRANAVAKLAGSIVETVRMEIEVQRFSRQIPENSPAIEAVIGGKPLALGA